MIVALWLTPMNRLGISVRTWSTLGVFFITGVIPTVTLLMLIHAGKVSDASVSERRQRPIPILVAILCYIGAAFYLGSLHAPRWLQAFLIAGSLIAAIELIITLRWKISAHTGASGGLAGFIFWLALRGALSWNPLILISIAILELGLVAWSRLYLRRHTVGQVATGATLGFVVALNLLLLV